MGNGSQWNGIKKKVIRSRLASEYVIARNNRDDAKKRKKLKHSNRKRSNYPND